jgi:hypothetical protein
MAQLPMLGPPVITTPWPLLPSATSDRAIQQAAGRRALETLPLAGGVKPVPGTRMPDMSACRERHGSEATATRQLRHLKAVPDTVARSLTGAHSRELHRSLHGCPGVQCVTRSLPAVEVAETGAGSVDALSALGRDWTSSDLRCRSGIDRRGSVEARSRDVNARRAVGVREQMGSGQGP